MSTSNIKSLITTTCFFLLPLSSSISLAKSYLVRLDRIGSIKYLETLHFLGTLVNLATIEDCLHGFVWVNKLFRKNGRTDYSRPHPTLLHYGITLSSLPHIIKTSQLDANIIQLGLKILRRGSIRLHKLLANW